jgi:CRISPR/Cas system CSM-associated protein Csm3 (group 7 of RAMP superfamily)
MKRRVYYRLEMELASPLSIGNGMNEGTDHDVIRGKDKKPYIPASSIAGVFRHTLDGKEKSQTSIFGTINGNEAQSSKVIFYDGQLLTGGTSNVRDGVRLENKVGVKGKKFDMEVIETGARFVTFIEITDQPEETDVKIEMMIAKLKVGALRFGTKTSRGFGAVKIISLKKTSFDLEQAQQMDKWLDFSVYDESIWEGTDEYAIDDADVGYVIIKLQLVQNGAISIREYSTDVSDDNDPLPDFKHIALSDGTSVIPGTSWAGAFKSKYVELAGSEEAAEKLFGYVNENDKKDPCACSRIIFSESIIRDDLLKTMTRNSIDRFSAAAKDTALYTERTSYNGKTELEIILKEDVTAREKAILGAVILDIHNGFLSVGGLTSVGRGMFTVTGLSVNKTDRYPLLLSGNAAKLLEVE